MGEETHSSELSWEVTYPNICPISSYTLEYTYTRLCEGQEGGGGQLTVPGADTTARNSFTLNELQPYSDFVVCLNIDGSLEMPVCCNNQTLEDVPEKPDNLTVIDRSQHSLSLSWAPMQCSNGLVSRWHLTCPSGDILEMGIDMLEYTCDGLSPGHTYTIILQAVNNAGYGEKAETKGTTLYSDTTNWGLIIGASIGLLLLVILLAGGGYYYTKKTKKGKNTKGIRGSGDVVGGNHDKEYDSYSNEMYMKQQKTYSDQQSDSAKSKRENKEAYATTEIIDQDRKTSIERENNFRDFGVLPRLSSVKDMPKLKSKKSSGSQSYPDMIKMSEIPRNMSLQAGLGHMGEAGGEDLEFKSSVDQNRRHSVHPIVQMKSPTDFPEHYEQRAGASHEEVPGGRKDRRYSYNPSPSRRPPYEDRRYSHNVNVNKGGDRRYVHDINRRPPGGDQRYSHDVSMNKGGDRRYSHDANIYKPGDRRYSHDISKPLQPRYSHELARRYSHQPRPRPSPVQSGHAEPSRRPSEPIVNHSYDRAPDNIRRASLQPGRDMAYYRPSNYPRPSQMYSRNLPDIIDE